MAVKPIPEGYRTFTPYYVIEGASDFIDFLKKDLSTEVIVHGLDRRIRHLEPVPADRVITLKTALIVIVTVVVLGALAGGGAWLRGRSAAAGGELRTSSTRI